VAHQPDQRQKIDLIWQRSK